MNPQTPKAPSGSVTINLLLTVKENIAITTAAERVGKKATELVRFAMKEASDRMGVMDPDQKITRSKHPFNELPVRESDARVQLKVYLDPYEYALYMLAAKVVPDFDGGLGVDLELLLIGAALAWIARHQRLGNRSLEGIVLPRQYQRKQEGEHDGSTDPLAQ